MSETQAKGKKLDMKISRKTINAIHQSKTANVNINTFKEEPTKKETIPEKRSLSLKISRKKDVPAKRTIELANTTNDDSNLVDELLADLVVNPTSTDDIVSESSTSTSDIFTKLDSLDNDDFSIANNDIPVDFGAIDKVYGANNISEIQTIKDDNKPKRTVKSARRGIVKMQKIEQKPEEEKPYYMVVDTDINYDEILSRPNKKASEMIDQNSSFFYTPNIFTDSDIKYSDVDLTENYGGDYLLEDYITPDNGIKRNFIGGSDDEEFFKRPKPRDYYSRRNTYIIESHEADDSAFDIIERIGKYDLDIVDRIDDLEVNESNKVLEAESEAEGNLNTAVTENNVSSDIPSEEKITEEKNVTPEIIPSAESTIEPCTEKNDEPTESDANTVVENADAAEVNPETAAEAPIPDAEPITENANSEVDNLDNVDELMSDALLAEILASDDNDDLSEITKMIDDSSKAGFESKIFGNNSNDDDSDFINTLDNLEDLEDLENLNKIENINDLDTLDHLDDASTASESVEPIESTPTEVQDSADIVNEYTNTSTDANDTIIEKKDSNTDSINSNNSFEVAAGNVFNYEPINKPGQDPKPRKSRFSNSIFKTFTFDDSSDLLGKDEIMAAAPQIDETIHENYLERASENVSPANEIQASSPTSIQKPAVDPTISVAKESIPTSVPVEIPVDVPIEINEPIDTIPDAVIEAKSAKDSVKIIDGTKIDTTLPDEESLFDLEKNDDVIDIDDEDKLEMVSLHTNTTFVENDFDINDDIDDEDIADDYSLDDDSGIDFADDSYGYTEDGFKKLIPTEEDLAKEKEKEKSNTKTKTEAKVNKEEKAKSKINIEIEPETKSKKTKSQTDDNEINTDKFAESLIEKLTKAEEAEDIEDKETENIVDKDVNDINLDDISIDDIDLTDIDLTNDDILDGLSAATPTSEEITKKLTDQFSSLDKDLQDELLSEVLLDSEETSSILDDTNSNTDSGEEKTDEQSSVENIEKDEESENSEIIENADDSDDKLEDNEFYKLINSLSNTITNLENSISMPDLPEEPPKEKEEKKKSGKAINILINKDDIFSISIENETYDIVADFTDISVVSQNINISTPKNNFFTKIGNKYIEIHRKEDSNFVVYTNFEDIEFENAINNINFTKKKDKIELNIKESFKLASIDNKVSLSILNSNIAKIKRPGVADEEESDTDKSNSVCDSDVLTINEETQKVYLPYKIEDVMNMIKNPANGYHTIKEVVEGEYTIPMSTFKPPIVSRFKEAYNFMRTKENSSVYAALDLALELMFNANLNPAIIRACSNLRELNVYLDCLYENELEKFDCFKIVYKVLPRIR